MSLIALAIAVAVQSAPPPPVDCTDANHRAFDFWIGDWAVSQTGGTAVIAKSKIEKIVGCAISETYDQTMGPGGRPVDYHGRSISSYVPAEGGWRQYYVDNGGAAVSLTGGIVNGAMVLSNKLPVGDSRMTLTANPDGSVRQHGELSTDGGKNWSTTFDFTYRKR